MVKIRKDYFSAEQICGSGQCFRMKKTGPGKYSVTAYGKYLMLEQQGDEITFYCTEEEFQKLWEPYFDLNTEYGRFARAGTQDSYLEGAVSFGRGIRILRQDVWEVLISFIISQQNNIKRITKCIETICERYGEQKSAYDGIVYHAFPTPGALAAAGEEELRSCGLGYRSRYLAKTSAAVAGGDVDLEGLKQLEYPRAKAELMSLSGVGNKVADCICLYGLHHLDAFPVDTHIRQVLDEHYPSGFRYENFPGYAGIIQQYLFYYDLNKMGGGIYEKEPGGTVSR